MNNHSQNKNTDPQNNGNFINIIKNTETIYPQNNGLTNSNINLIPNQEIVLQPSTDDEFNTTQHSNVSYTFINTNEVESSNNSHYSDNLYTTYQV